MGIPDSMRRLASAGVFPGLFLAVVAGCRLLPDAAPPSGRMLFSSAPDTAAGSVAGTQTWLNAYDMEQHLDRVDRQDGQGWVYVHHAFTSVCGGPDSVSDCRPHRYRAWYDETGHYLGYEVREPYPFTRREHQPFTTADYARLDEMLRNPVHPFSHLPAEKVSAAGPPSVEGAVDGVTGATLTYYAGTAVSNAFYTSFTVWTQAHRELPDRVRAWTLDQLTPGEVRAWINRGEVFKTWWFLDHTADSALSASACADLAYQCLSGDDARLQGAALRCLENRALPFRPDEARADAYDDLSEDVRPAFLDWWGHQAYAPDILLNELAGALQESGWSRASCAHVLDYLGATDRAGDPRFAQALKALAARHPSTYIRQKAAALSEPAR